MKRASDHRRTAREVLKGNRLKVFTALFFTLMMSGFSYSSSVHLELSPSRNSLAYLWQESGITLDIGVTIPLTTATFFLYLFFLLLFAVLYPAAQLGYTRFCLNLIDRQEAKASQVFSGYVRFWKALGTSLLIDLRMIGWGLLFTVPMGTMVVLLPGYVPALVWYTVLLAVFVGLVYISLGYMFAFHVLADQPDLSPSQAISESVRLMSGNRWRLFCLELSFIGWLLPPFLFALLLELPPFFSMLLNPVLFQALSIIALLFDLLYSFLFLSPYMDTACCSFYRELTTLPADTKEQEMPDIPPEEAPAEDVSAEETPSAETLSEETISEETPAEEDPTK